MQYTKYDWRIEMLMKAYKKGVVDKLYPKEAKRELKRMSYQDRSAHIRREAISNEMMFRGKVLVEEVDEQKCQALLQDTVISLIQMATEELWRKGSREVWFPETAHLLEVLSRVEMNALPEELYSGEVVTRLIHFPLGFRLDGRAVTSALVTLATPPQMRDVSDDFVRRYDLSEGFLDIQAGGDPDSPRIFIVTCTGEDFLVADFELSRIENLLAGKVQDDQLRCITPYDHHGLVPQWALEHPDESRTRCIDHLNIALRLLIYAQAFPEVLVDFEIKPQKGQKKRRNRRLTTHKRIKKDPLSVRFITHRRGYNKRAHTRVLRAARFTRNGDGTPRVVPVKECWVPAIGYIGSRKKTVKELEREAIVLASA